MSDTSKTFDRVLILLSLFGVLTLALAIVAALGEPASNPAEASIEDGPITPSIELTEFSITGDLEIPSGDVLIDLTNAGATMHNLAFENGPQSQDLNGGESAVFDAGDLEPGTYTIFCAIPGHREAGMEARLIVGLPMGVRATPMRKR